MHFKTTDIVCRLHEVTLPQAIISHCNVERSGTCEVAQWDRACVTEVGRLGSKPTRDLRLVQLCVLHEYKGKLYSWGWVHPDHSKVGLKQKARDLE